MALLYCPRFQAFDENGDPIAGAQLATYDSVSTSTPKATYSDAGRTVEHANPVVADANGVFPQIFGAEGEGYYCALLDANDNQIDEFQAVQMVGQDGTSVFLRDFGLNGRMQAYGAGGVVNLEFMPAEGDDTGGQGRIGGAEGTQGEALELDFAETEVAGSLTVGGVVTFGENPLGVVCVVDQGVESGASELIVELPANYSSFALRMSHAEPSADGLMRAQFSYDNGATYASTAGDYLSYYWTPAATTNTTATGMIFANLLKGSADMNGVDMKIVLHATAQSGIMGQSISRNQLLVFSGQCDFATTRPTHIRFLMASGTFGCQWALLGVRDTA